MAVTTERHVFQQMTGLGSSHQCHWDGGFRTNPFMSSTSNWLDNLKLRLSYGTLGNQTYYDDGNQLYIPYISTMGIGQSPYMMSSAGRIPYVSPAGLVSPTLTWETVETKNIGLDITTLGSETGFVVRYVPPRYQKHVDGCAIPLHSWNVCPAIQCCRFEDNRMGTGSNLARPHRAGLALQCYTVPFRITKQKLPSMITLQGISTGVVMTD